MKMDAIEFLTERKRMCEYYKAKCDECDLFGIYQPYLESHFSCDYFVTSIKPYKCVELVEKWSKEHPRKTRLQDLFEKYPNAPKTTDGIPRVCAAAIGYRDFCEVGCEDINCRKCWNETVE